MPSRRDAAPILENAGEKVVYYITEKIVKQSLLILKYNPIHVMCYTVECQY